MLSILLILLTALTAPLMAGNSYSAISYRLTPIVSEEKPFLQITMIIEGTIPDPLTLTIPSSWAGCSYTEQIRNIKLAQSEEPLPIQFNASHEPLIATPANNRLEISYEIHQKSPIIDDVNENIITNSLISIPGCGFFMKPDDLDWKIPLNFTITWQQLPDEWSCLSSISNCPESSIHIDYQTIMDTFYSAGIFRRITKHINGYPVHIALYGTFSESDDQIIKNIKTIIKSQRTFFHDFDFPYYAITYLASNNSCQEGMSSMNGTAFHNSFICCSSSTVDILRYKYVLAHEHMHTWIGKKILNYGDNGHYNYWFTEGFTDYYTLTLLLRSSIISRDEFIELANEFLHNYFHSPLIEQSNGYLTNNFWQSNEAQKLVYWRGFTLALLLNHIIQCKQPEFSLDMVINDLLHYSKNTGESFNKDIFIALLQPYITGNAHDLIEHYIEHGNPIQLDELMSALSLEKVSSYDDTQKKDVVAYQFKKDLSQEEMLCLHQFFCGTRS